ncbi:MAG: arsenate reductase ArsC [Gammaproteobacteria bacterium]|nr:arsenate reductase ArsC [Gammaproteobacteria bacterium]
MANSHVNVLILCTGNSCRSIIAEVLFNELGRGRVQAFSAGSHPATAVNPAALQKLQSAGHETHGLSSKSWDVFSAADAPGIDIVVTVCDNAAGEACPLWRGSPVTVHWGIADPADAEPDDAADAFELAYQQLRRRVEQTLELPLESFDVRYRKDALQRIHEAECTKESLRG